MTQESRYKPHLRVGNGSFEEVVQQQIGQLGVGFEGGLDLGQEHGADDAAASPHQRDRAVVELPVELSRRVRQQH